MNFNNRSTLIFALIITAMVAAGLVFQVQSLHSRLDSFADLVGKMGSGISYSDKRKNTVLHLYEVMMESNPKLNKDLAFKIADYDYYAASEVYKTFDPYLLLAIQWKETGGTFDPDLKSDAGAIGLNQMLPTTAKWIAKGLHWEWNDSYLNDPYRNIDMATSYLDFLFADLGKVEYVLAWYNGGKQQYINIKNGGVNSLCPETKDYVSSILKYREKIR